MKPSPRFLSSRRKQWEPVPRRQRCRRTFQPCLELTGGRLLLSTVMGVPLPDPLSQFDAKPIDPNTIVRGALGSADQVDVYFLNITKSGSLQVSVEARDGSRLDSRVSLFTSDSYLRYNNLRAGGG